VPLSLQIARLKLAGARRKVVRRGEHTQLPVEDVQTADPDPGPELAASRKENLIRLTQAILQLGERCRELMRLKLQGRTFAEIQKQMGAATLNTVYTWDFRCRQQLVEKMKEGEKKGKEDRL
jgi:RNA polymerase sigma-70 factor (ECF subfamily)